MQITRQQFDSMVKKYDFKGLSEETLVEWAETAIATLQGMHQITEIERVSPQGFAGALGLLEGRMLEILRAAEVKVPEYTMHPAVMDSFLTKNPFSKKAQPENVHGKSTAAEIAKLFG